MRYPKTSNLESIMKQVDNPDLTIVERNFIAWLMDQGLHELTTRESHQVMTWNVRIAYSTSPKRNGRVLLPGEN